MRLTPPAGEAATAALAGRPRWWLYAIPLAAAFLIRGPEFGNPRIHVDENFYLLVGDRMLHGALPYVDIWDRKPIGLFLIYAAIRLLGGVGIVQYQVVATLFAGATAMVVARMALRIAPPAAALVAALLYLLLLGLAQGGGGQAPVFYNLFTAIAATLVLRCWLGELDAAGIRRAGTAAMLLVGVGMQVKYTLVFEGLFFGVALMLCSWHASRRLGRVAVDALLWIVVAIAPTAAAFACYAAIGHAQEFLFANFLSIGARSGEGAALLAHRLVRTWNVLQLPVFCVVLAAVLESWRRYPQGAAAFGFVMLWLASALAGYAIFGTYFDHYALPLMLPIAIGAAPLFGYRRGGIGVIAAALILMGAGFGYWTDARHNEWRQGGARATAAILAAIQPRLKGCLYVFNGDPILYHLTGSCLPTRYPFPTHLNYRREAGAIGTDPVAEIARIMARHPSVVVDTVEHDEQPYNPPAMALARRLLRRDYRPTAIIPTGRDAVIVYERVTPR